MPYHNIHAFLIRPGITHVQTLYNYNLCYQFDVLNVLVVQITDVATLKAAREEDLKACGWKVGEIMKIRKVLQQEDGCEKRSEFNLSAPVSDISLLESSSSLISAMESEFSEHPYNHMDVDKSNQVCYTND